MSDTDKGSARASTGETPETDREAETRSPEEIQAEIAQTRQELGDTVDALSAKLDVKSRARNQLAASRRQAADQVQAARRRASQTATRGKDAATDEHGSLRPAVPATAAAAVVVVVAGVVWWRRRR